MRHLGPLFLVHGHDDRADGGGGEQQGDDFERQHVAADERVADVVHGDRGNGSLVAATALDAREHGPSEHRKDAGGDDEAHKPVRLKTPSLGRSEPRVSRMAKTIRMATAPM